MNTLFDQVKILHDAGLYEDLRTVASLVLTMSETNAELLTVAHKYQISVYYGDALYQNTEYRRAESIYRKAILLKKFFNKTKGKTSSPTEVISEVDVKYKIYECHLALRQYREAASVLEGISSKQRDAKVNMALAQLHQRTGMDRSAVTCYKEVLRECPLSLEAAQGLLFLGVKSEEVMSLITSAVPGFQNTDWIAGWVKGHALAACREYNSAVLSFKMLDSKPLLRDNVHLLCQLGEMYILVGDYRNARITLQRARSVDPLVLRNMDLLAMILAKEKEVKELEGLVTALVGITENAPEPWITLGYYSLITKKATRAVYFAQKAYVLDNRNVQALLLKGSGLLDLKKTQEAAQHFREALRLAPHRYEAHKGLVDAYLASHRIREAITVAGNSLKQLGTSARSLTLYSTVLAKETTNVDKAKTYLEKAMKLDPSHLDAVYAMSDILQQQQKYEAGIVLLRNQLRMQSTSRLHLLLGNFLTQTNDHQEALDQYSIALSLDPTNVLAKEGIERVEKRSDMGLESAYDMDIEDMTDNEGALERSDVESVWSDPGV